jgi:Tfp pilus assembly protein PilO
MKFDFNKILDYFNALEERSRYLVLGGVVLFILLIDLLFLAMPQMGSIADMNNQIKQISDDTHEVLTGRQRLVQLRKNLQDQRLELNSLSTKVRSVQEVPVLLSTISSIANEYGVKIDQLTPETSQQEALTKTPGNKYYALPVVIKARCGYHAFGRFLSKLENQDMYFILNDFIIQSNDKDVHTHLFVLTIKMVLEDKR